MRYGIPPINMKQVDNDKQTTLTHDFTVGHEYEVVVRAIGPDGTNQAMESAVRGVIAIRGKVSVPNTPTSLTTTNLIEAIRLEWANPLDYDMSRMEIWRSDSNTRETATKIAEVRGISYVDVIGLPNVNRYYWIRAVNASGLVSDYYPRTPAGVSGRTVGIVAASIDDFAITATKMFNKTVILTGDSWTNNSPGGGSIAWNAHSIVYNGASYAITAGNTSAAYVYWTIGSAIYSTSATHPMLGTTAFIIAINTSGTHTLVWNSSANMVIGTAFIADLAVTDAKIANLNVDKLIAGTIQSQAIVLAIDPGQGDTYIAAGKTDFTNADNGFILGLDDSDSDTPKFFIGDNTNYMNWDGSSLTVNGGVISSPVITDLQSGSEIGMQDWQEALGFSATDYNTLAWSGGDIKMVDGTTYAINPGNTGNIVNLTYLYFRPLLSTATLQTTTTAPDAVGAGRILIGVCSPSPDVTSQIIYQIFGGSGGVLLAVDNISANSASTNEFVSNTAQIKNLVVTDAKINTLTANKLTAGTIDASVITVTNLNATNISTGTLTGRTVQTAASGQRIVLSQADNTLRFHTATKTDVIVLDDNIVLGAPGIRVEDSTNGAVVNIKKTVNRQLWLYDDHMILFNDAGTNTIGLYMVLSGEENYAGIHIDLSHVGATGHFVICRNNAGIVCTLDIDGNFDTVGFVDAAAGFKDNGAAGVDGTFIDNGGNTITVSGGIITSLS